MKMIKPTYLFHIAAAYVLSVVMFMMFPTTITAMFFGFISAHNALTLFKLSVFKNLIAIEKHDDNVSINGKEID